MERPTVFSDHRAKDNRLWFTSDNLVFFDEQNAVKHSKHLANKTITSKTKEVVEEEFDQILNDTSEDETEYGLIDDPEF